MNAKATSPTALPYNPSMFKWARERRERTAEETARRLKTRPEMISAWESGEERPTVRQARQLAEFYERSFMEFFLSEPPIIPEPDVVPDFRMRRSTERPSLSRDLKGIQIWAEAMRENALDLYASIGESPPSIPLDLMTKTAEAPEVAAASARLFLDLSVDRQMSMTQSEAAQFPKVLRSALETAGILVLKQTQLGGLSVRGLCIFFNLLPVIVFGGESPSAQVFTMAHEFGHVLLGQSAISGPLTQGDDRSSEWVVENWCDKFAASFLMPADVLMNIWTKPNAPARKIADEELNQLARSFRVSRHSMLIRLVQLGYVDADYYWNVKHPVFEEEERDYKSFGRPSYYGSRFRSTCGDLYTGLVLEAWTNGAITGHSAAEFLGTRSFKHLDDIKREFST